jgi:peptidoglycan/LPS O-acetylase OafA/YrhL
MVSSARVLPGIAVHGPVQPKAFSAWLDLFRWVAAFDVLWGHVYARYLPRYLDQPADERSILHLIFAFPAGFIHFAVMIFFVLSGYLVGGALLAEVRRTNTIDITRYLVHRLVRLWIVLLPALVVTGVLDLIGLAAHPPDPSLIYGPRIWDDLGAGTFICNAVFLQTVHCWEYGYNNAFWSLPNEFWYYVAWPFIAFVLVGGPKPQIRLAAAVSAIALLASLNLHQFDGRPIASYMLVWVLGVGVAVAKKPLFSMPLWLSAAIFLAATVGFRLLVRHAQHLADPNVFLVDRLFLVDLGVSLTFANMLVAMKAAGGLRAPPGARLHKRLAGFSYSLYAVHEPIVNCVNALAMLLLGVSTRTAPQDLGSWSIILAAMALAIGGSYLFSLGTEAHTDRARRWIMEMLKPSAARSTPRP